MKERNIVGVRVSQARKEAIPPITQGDLIARLQVIGIMFDQSTIVQDRESATAGDRH